MPRREGTLIRVLNNNAVMVELDGARVILLGRGLGFGRRLGDPIDYADASEVFTPTSPDGFFELSEFVAQIPLEVFRVSRRAVDLAAEKSGIRPSQALLLSIADHLNFAVHRAREGIVIDFPLSWEVRQLYPNEAALGEATVEIAQEELEVVLDHVVEGHHAAGLRHLLLEVRVRTIALLQVTLLLGAAVSEGVRPSDDGICHGARCFLVSVTQGVTSIVGDRPREATLPQSGVAPRRPGAAPSVGIASSSRHARLSFLEAPKKIAHRPFQLTKERQH